jgi:hypothetical protein
MWSPAVVFVSHCGYKATFFPHQPHPFCDMAERPTAKHVSIDLDGFKASVDKQFALLTRLMFGLFALIGAVVGGGFLLRGDLADIKVQVGKPRQRSPPYDAI